MVSFKGEIGVEGYIDITGLIRFEHHKIVISVSDLESENAIFTINELIDGQEINLDCVNETELFCSEETNSYLIENMRINNIRVRLIEGNCKAKVYYEGW